MRASAQSYRGGRRVAKFSIVIKVETLPSGRKVDSPDPRVISRNLTMPKKLRTLIEDRMRGWVLRRTEAGVDVNGRPFAPKKDGTPATLRRTGTMLASVRGASASDIRQNVGRFSHQRAVAWAGLVCDVPNTARRVYPYVVNYGKNLGDGTKIKAQEVRYRRMIERKQRRLSQYALQYGLHTVQRMADELRRAQDKLRELMSIDPGKMFPGREWFGLTPDEQELVETYLQEWAWAATDALVSGCLDPRSFADYMDRATELTRSAIQAAA